jgi:predicted HicB family RNase H-like nuclease
MPDRVDCGMREPPRPSPSPADEPPFSLRIDLSAHNAAMLCAHDEGCSVSDVLLRALRLGLDVDGLRSRNG